MRFTAQSKKYGDVQRRANQTLIWEKQSSGVGLLDTALIYLAIGRASSLQSQYKHELSTKSSKSSLDNLSRAVDDLRQASQQQYILLALLARAEYYRVTGDLVKAQKDVDEAFTIATRGGMGLHLADCHLEYARLKVAMSKVESQTSESRPSTFDLRPEALLDEARKHLVIAKEMINKMGYHRRDKEVEELEKELTAG